jgi:hypothetical protein
MTELEQEYHNFIEQGTMKVWGKEITMDCRCDVKKVNCPENLSAFLKELVVRIDMKAYKEPQIELFGEGGLYGYSALQWIQTSCITLHSTLDGQLYLNLFSCKTFDEGVVKKCVLEYFGGEVDYMEMSYRGVKI